jgi:hypothetical protein
MNKCVRLIVSALAIAGAASAMCSANARAGDLAGGGTFVLDSNAVPQSVVVLGIQGVKLRRHYFGVPQYPVGQGSLSSLPQEGAPEQFFTKFDVDCVMLESFNGRTGDYELVFSGTMTGGQWVYDNNPTNTVPFTGTVDPTGDHIVGRLVRKNGVVSRSDWTSGYENCVGIGQPSLFLDDGTPIQQGTNTAAEYTTCAGNFAALPTCASFAPGGYNEGMLVPDRSLGGDIEFQSGGGLFWH